MYRVMVKHAYSNSDERVVEHCRVRSRSIANAIARQLGEQRFLAYNETEARDVKAYRYSLVYVDELSTGLASARTGPCG